MKKLITIIILIGAVLTLALLGTWQVQRLTWKNKIIANLEAEYQKYPSKNIYDFSALQKLEIQENPILFGRVEGAFVPNKKIFLKPKTYNGKVGAHVIQPFKILNDEGFILVNRGWIQEEDIEQYKNAYANQQTIDGIFRKPDWNNFTSNNRPDLNIWTKPDIQQIANNFEIENIAPVMLYATSIDNNQDLILQDAKWYPRNKHIQYAVFWYGMIFILLILIGFASRPKKIN